VAFTTLTEYVYSIQPKRADVCSENMSADLPPQPRARDAAGYIAELTADLARLARESGFKELAYLLEVARLEAETAPARRAKMSRRGRRMACFG
jgi:hypothetical protein